MTNGPDPLRMHAYDVCTRASAMVDATLHLAHLDDIHPVDWHEHALSALQAHHAAMGELLAVYENTIARRRARAGAA